MTRPSLRKQQAFKDGYQSGRNGESWTKPRLMHPWQNRQPIGYFYRGWNLGHRVTRRLAVNDAANG